jgi:quercetin dioxygenase-like cupin family protein
MRIARLAALTSEASDPNTFTGHARMTRMPGLSDAPAIKAFRVEFDPEARTHWHTHSGPQLLVVLEGRCRVQREGEPVREIVAGDVASIEAGERHWHGASADGAMTHLAVNIDSVTTWLEAVSDAEYAGRG